MSGIVIQWLGYSLMGLGVLLLLIPGWSLIKRILRTETVHDKAKIVVTNKVQLGLVKLFHEGKDVQANLNGVRAHRDISEQVSAEIHFESWFTDVSNTLKNTEFLNLWYENKVVNYRKDSLDDYIGASERALSRLESIVQLVADKGGSRN